MCFKHISYSRTDSNRDGSSMGSVSTSKLHGAFQSWMEPLPDAMKKVAVTNKTTDEAPNNNLHQPAN